MKLIAAYGQERYRAGVEIMQHAAFEESWQIGVEESELDAFEDRLKHRTAKLLAEQEEK